MLRPISITFIFLLFVVGTAGQSRGRLAKYSALLRTQIECRANPKAGALLLELQQKKIISSPYNVVDSVNYFSFNKPIELWGFKPKAVFGWQVGYPKFFTRGPGTSPPEMVGIVVSDSVTTVKDKLEKLGIGNLHIEESVFDLKGNNNESDKKFTEISCWEKH